MFRSLLIFLTLYSHVILAQDDPYHIKRSEKPILLDGVLDEPAWVNAQILTNFTQNFPTDSLPSSSKTEIRLTYDDKFIYFSGVMYAQEPDRTYVTPSLRRDFRGASNDAIVFNMDTFSDNTNAFQFGVNPFGVQREGLLSNGGTRGGDLDLSWDNKWYVEAKQYEGYWVAEAAIPLKSIRYKEGSESWNIKFYRIDSETGERTVSASTTQNFGIYSLAFVNKMIWDEPLKKPSTNISVIPYVASGINQDFEDPEQANANTNLSVGGDAKIGIGAGLNLDLTINPDFSQVEVDQQVTNLDRFEIFFPERRQFFLENADLFSDFGHPLARPFFSRRIGVAIDSSTGQNVQNKIIFGARLSGKLDNNWRIGLLNMQAGKDDEFGIPSSNYTVAAVQRKVFGRSNISAIFVNKEVFTEMPNGDVSMDDNGYARIVGVDYNIASMDNKWTGKVFYHHELDTSRRKGNFSHAAYVNYDNRTWRLAWAHTTVGENYDAPVGYVPRRDFFRINPEGSLRFFPNSDKISQYSFDLETEIFWKKGDKTDHRHRLRYSLNFKNTAEFRLSYSQRYTLLFNEFEPTRTDGIPLAAGTDYIYNSVEAEYQSDYRRQVGFQVNGSAGEYFNGDRYNLRGEVNVRFQPYGSIALNLNYNKINLPAPYNSADLLLVGPRFDVTFSKSLFFTSFIQYNNQIENLNINTRLQWRFAPVSDIFLVYTDNYGTVDPLDRFALVKKNRALVFKITYWLTY